MPILGAPGNANFSAIRFDCCIGCADNRLHRRAREKVRASTVAPGSFPLGSWQLVVDTQFALECSTIINGASGKGSFACVATSWRKLCNSKILSLLNHFKNLIHLVEN